MWQRFLFSTKHYLVDFSVWVIIQNRITILHKKNLLQLPIYFHLGIAEINGIMTFGTYSQSPLLDQFSCLTSYENSQLLPVRP